MTARALHQCIALHCQVRGTTTSNRGRACPLPTWLDPLLSVHIWRHHYIAETRRKLSQEAASFMGRGAEKLLLLAYNHSHKEEAAILWVMELL